MDWRHIRHVPVEDGAGRLVGFVTHRSLLRMMTNGPGQREAHPLTVKEIMVSNPLTVSPSTSSLEAIEIMRKHKAGCLPVVEGDRLVGIVTSYDFLEASARLFKEQLDIPTPTPSESHPSGDVDPVNAKAASYHAGSGGSFPN
jgi:CBS domain-containing protein